MQVQVLCLGRSYVQGGAYVQGGVCVQGGGSGTNVLRASRVVGSQYLRPAIASAQTQIGFMQRPE